MTDQQYPPDYPVYTFVADDGENFVIDIPKLYEWVSEQPDLEVFLTPVRPHMLELFQDDNSIDVMRVLDMMARRSVDPNAYRDPIIMLLTGTLDKELPDAILADGHHRYALAILEGEPLIDTYVLEPEQWERYRIHNRPVLTKEQLRVQPVRPRREDEDDPR